MEDSGRCRRGYIVEGLGAAQFAVPGAIDRVRAMSRPDGPDGAPTADGGFGGVAADRYPGDVAGPDGDGSFAAVGTGPVGVPGPGPLGSGGDLLGPGGVGRPGRAGGPGPAGGRPGPAHDGPSRVVLAAADPAQPYGAALPWPETVGDTGHRPARKAGALLVLVDGAPVLYVERGGRSLLSFAAERDALRAGAEALAAAVHEGWLGTLAVERADGAGSLGSDLAEVLTEAGFRVTPKGLRLRA
jgi:ATP-dependent Lhr-like helicase